jgi:hypothetical protein
MKPEFGLFFVIPAIFGGYLWVLDYQREVLQTADPSRDTGPSLAYHGLVTIVGPLVGLLCLICLITGFALSRNRKKREKG